MAINKVRARRRARMACVWVEPCPLLCCTRLEARLLCVAHGVAANVGATLWCPALCRPVSSEGWCCCCRPCLVQIDKEAANVERTKQMLAEVGILPEEWGGETPMIPVSAHQGTGMAELLENIMLQAEVSATCSPRARLRLRLASREASAHRSQGRPPDGG